jgi:alpha-tubulin suppressor-like RCC1 family protein
MTFGVTNVINCINQSAIRTDLTALELLQLTGSDCQFDKCAVFSAACQASLPTASCNTGRFVYITSECKYYFSNGSIWTDDVDSQLVSSIYSWGNGADGRLGDNSTVNKSSPVSVVGGFTDWCQISSGFAHSVAVRQNGTVWAWGCNNCGQLGDNSTVSKSSPVSVVGGFTDWCQIAGGYKQSLAIRQNGSAWGWGCNGTGQLGDNTTVTKSSPVSVVGGFTNWCQISSVQHTLGVRTNGTLWAWGPDGNGALGINAAGNFSSPVSVVGGFTDWCQASAGGEAADNAGFSFAVRQNGTLWAWGAAGSGNLGNNCNINISSPVSVVGGFTDWCQVSASIYFPSFGVAVRQNGTAWAWGCNNNGQLGTDNTTNRSSPVSVVGGFTDWCQISAGRHHSLAVRQNGTAWAWGYAGTGNLGNNCNTNRSSPVSVVGGFTDWHEVSGGHNSSLGLRKTKGF